MRSIKTLGLLSLTALVLGVLAMSTNMSAFAETDDDILEAIEYAFGIESQKIKNFDDCIAAGYMAMESNPRKCKTDEGAWFVENDEDDPKYDKKAIHEKLDMYCKMSDQERDAFLASHKGVAQYQEKINTYCEMSQEDREQYIDTHKEQHDKTSDMRSKDDKHGHDQDPREKMDMLCELSDEERKEKIAQYHDDVEVHYEMVKEYCSLEDSERDDFIEKHRESIKGHHESKNQTKTEYGGTDMKGHHESKNQTKTEYGGTDMKGHHESKNQTKTEYADMKDKHGKMTGISDAQKEELRMKFKMAHSDLTDEQRDAMIMDIKSKFDEHKIKYEQKFSALSDDEKQQIHQQIDMMKENHGEISRDMRALTSPLKQMMTGLTVDDMECRDGQILVIKTNTGMPACLSESTAEKLIERKVIVLA